MKILIIILIIIVLWMYRIRAINLLSRIINRQFNRVLRNSTSWSRKFPNNNNSNNNSNNSKNRVLKAVKNKIIVIMESLQHSFYRKKTRLLWVATRV